MNRSHLGHAIQPARAYLDCDRSPDAHKRCWSRYVGYVALHKRHCPDPRAQACPMEAA